MPPDDSSSSPASSSPPSDASPSESKDSIPSGEVNERPAQPAEQLLNEPESEVGGEELLDKAREFLVSPAIRYQDTETKRQFLLSKGVSSGDAERLLEETDTPPPIPPRTYLPPAAPSQLPTLLASLAQTAGILSAVSGATLWIYQASIFPRLSDSFAARHAIRMHQTELAAEIAKRLEALRNELAVFAPLASVEGEGEGEEAGEGEKAFPAEGADGENVTPEGKNEKSEEKEGENAEDADAHGPILDIADLPPAKVDYSALPNALQSLSALLSPSSTSTSISSLRTTSSRTLQSLTDLSAYISSETYNIPNASFFRLGGNSGRGGGKGLGSGNGGGGVEEEIRREMRVMKGLVLNRRSFAAGYSTGPSTGPIPYAPPTVPRSPVAGA